MNRRNFLHQTTATTLLTTAAGSVTLSKAQAAPNDRINIGVIGVGKQATYLMAKAMNLVSSRKINPLIGSAGVSAVPMAARVSQVEGQKYDPSNYLLMHAMGPNVAGVIGTALVAGYFISTVAR